MRFKRISSNWFGWWINNHLVIWYIINNNLLCLYRVSHKVIMPFDVFSLPMKFQILSELDSYYVVTQQLNRVMNLWSEVKILEKTLKPYCLLSSNATSNVLCLYSWQRYVVLLLTAPWYGSPTQGEYIFEGKARFIPGYHPNQHLSIFST